MHLCRARASTQRDTPCLRWLAPAPVARAPRRCQSSLCWDCLAKASSDAVRFCQSSQSQLAVDCLLKSGVNKVNFKYCPRVGSSDQLKCLKDRGNKDGATCVPKA